MRFQYERSEIVLKSGHAYQTYFLTVMRFIDEQLIERWEDGSIPKRAKGELIKKFHEQFDYKSNTFAQLMAKKQQPTPDQDLYLTQMVTQYWNFYNQHALTGVSESTN